MSVSLMSVLAGLTIASSLAILVVALTRKSMRRIAGARVAYWLWLLVPASALVLALPAPSGSAEIAAHAFPSSILSTFRAPASSEHTIGAADYAFIGLFVWAVGSALMLALMVCRQRAFMRSLGNLVSVQDGTFRSVSVSGPALIGVLRPRIVLPIDFETRYSREECTLILAHEHAHRNRGDIVFNAIAAIWLCFFWFNPLMYWAIARFRFDQELACDAAVLTGSSAGRRCYADALLKAQLAADAAWRMPIDCHWQRSHPLKERIAMLKQPPPGLSRRLSGAVLTAALIASGSYAAWAAQPESARMAASQDENQRFTFSADRISTSASGDIDYSGNVVMKPIDPDGLEVTWNADTANRAGDGSTVLEGSVRFSFAAYILTTDRATLFKDGTIKMDSARLSRTSEAG